MTLDVRIRAERVLVGERFSVSFQRTQRITESLHDAPAPPSWGVLPVHAVSDFPEFAAKVSDVKNAFLIPVARDEAVWLGFGGAAWKPNALKVGFAGRNVITREKLDKRLHTNPQNYLVCPPQLSLEGIRAGDGSLCQIVPGSPADAANRETSVLSLIVYEPKRGIFPEQPPDRATGEINVLHSLPELLLNDADDEAREQKTKGDVSRDPYGIETWDPEPISSISVYMVDHQQYEKITGREPPPRPSDRDVYQGNCLP